MVRTREDLFRFFSDELINSEVERVKKAKAGSVIFIMETWENSDFADSIISLAEAKVHIEKKDGIARFIKD